MTASDLRAGSASVTASGSAAGSARPIRRIDAGDASTLAEGAARAVVVDGRPIAVWRIDGALRAYSGACLHRGGPLAEGFVRDGIVTCPLHWWRYDLRTGSLVGRPEVRLAAYSAVEVDGRIVVEVPVSVPAAGDPGAESSIRERLLRHARSASAVGAAGDGDRAASDQRFAPAVSVGDRRVEADGDRATPSQAASRRQLSEGEPAASNPAQEARS